MLLPSLQLSVMVPCSVHHRNREKSHPSALSTWQAFQTWKTVSTVPVKLLFSTSLFPLNIYHLTEFAVLSFTPFSHSSFLRAHCLWSIAVGTVYTAVNKIPTLLGLMFYWRNSKQNDWMDGWMAGWIDRYPYMPPIRTVNTFPDKPTRCRVEEEPLLWHQYFCS